MMFDYDYDYDNDYDQISQIAKYYVFCNIFPIIEIIIVSLLR